MIATILPRLDWLKLYRWACWLIALVCMGYMTYTLNGYLQADPVGYLPSVGQWLIGLFLVVMLIVTRKGMHQLFNLIWLTGLTVIALVF